MSMFVENDTKPNDAHVKAHVLLEVGIALESLLTRCAGYFSKRRRSMLCFYMRSQMIRTLKPASSQRTYRQQTHASTEVPKKEKTEKKPPKPRTFYCTRHKSGDAIHS